jgi:phosphoenolpyruvate synthase/pyruvate phosphate dikinase
MMEYFGQSPIIVRSSSLLEDNFGNAFAGKYESVFCANQGLPEERFEAFENAVRTVYASAMSHDALTYRQSCGLADKDEQMAILVQRVSGDHYGELFFPHIGGVGYSFNMYVWNKEMYP